MNNHPVMWSLVTALGIQPSDLVALVGGGGKSSLMFSLADEWDGVVLTTTTRIFTEQMKNAPAVCVLKNDSTLGVSDNFCLSEALRNNGRCLVIGTLKGEKAHGVSAEVPMEILDRKDVTLVVVEADGSRMKPCKAPAEHEPVLPVGTSLVVPVVGIDALGHRIDQVCHRPERVSDVTGLKESELLSASAVATLLTHTRGGLKNVPQNSKVVAFINKVETEERILSARTIAKEALHEDRLSRVVLGKVKSQNKVVEVHRRVTAIVLAAGESVRMGSVKQLLPWGESTVLGTTLGNLKSSGVHDILLVTGFEAEEVESIGNEQEMSTIYNPDYSDGEMLSSLKVAIRSLPDNREAILVVLADQPMVDSGTIDQILIAFWQRRGELIAPTYKNKRGNPVLIGRRYFPDLLRLPHGAAPRDLLSEKADALQLIPVNTPTILYDLDSPQDYERWRPGN
jgi:molybdenum cofactor cytidylyltransferase